MEGLAWQATKRRVMHKRSSIVVLVVALTLPGIVSTTPTALVKQPVDAKVYPGISVAVGSVARGLISAQAYGSANLAAGTPMTPETPLHIASVSKSITATA